MTIILLILASGIVFGFFAIRKPSLIHLNTQLLNGAIYLLLFLLGITVGTNKDVVHNISRLGLEAFLIAIASIAGSVVLCYILWKLLFKAHEK